MTSRLAESHSIVYVRELPPGVSRKDMYHTDGWLQETAIACAHDWAELNGVEITPHPCAETKDGNREAGCWWVVDIGKGVDNDPQAGPNRGSLFDNLTWTWSVRWEHWNAWFSSMVLASRARFADSPADGDGILRGNVWDAIRAFDAAHRIRTANVVGEDGAYMVRVPSEQEFTFFDGPDADVDVIVNGDDQVVAVHPREDTPLAQALTDLPETIPHFTLSAPPGFLPTGDYTITRTRIPDPGPDVDAVHDAAWADDDES